MPKLTPSGLKWLKGFHLLAVACWVGGGVALLLLYFLKNGVADGRVLYGINQSIHHSAKTAHQPRRAFYVMRLI